MGGKWGDTEVKNSKWVKAVGPDKEILMICFSGCTQPDGCTGVPKQRFLIMHFVWCQQLQIACLKYVAEFYVGGMIYQCTLGLRATTSHGRSESRIYPAICL